MGKRCDYKMKQFTRALHSHERFTRSFHNIGGWLGVCIHSLSCAKDDVVKLEQGEREVTKSFSSSEESQR